MQALTTQIIMCIVFHIALHVQIQSMTVEANDGGNLQIITVLNKVPIEYYFINY